MHRTLPLLLAPLLLLSPASAEVFKLEDGTQLEGAYIGEADGKITIMPAKGALVVLDRAKVATIDWSHKLDAKLNKKIARVRANFSKKQARAIKKLLRSYKRADADERAALEKKLDGLSPELLLKPLTEMLAARDAETRSMAVRRLAALESTKAVGPLVRAALTAKGSAFSEEAHAAASRVDSTLARRFYEEVAASKTKPARRVRALGFLKGMGDRGAVPGLVRVLEHVNSEIKATLATAGGLRRIPVNLGTTGASGSNVPIELPEVSMTQIQTSVAVPVSVLRRIRGAAVEALNGVTGQDFGDDAGAWERWWQRQPKKKADKD